MAARELRRVVVTGVGAITPVGHTAPETWQNLLDGVSGIGPITLFDATDYAAKFAAEVKDYDEVAVFGKSEVRRTDRFTQFALLAAREAVADAGDLGLDPERVGCYVGSGVGGLQTMVDQHEVLLERGPARVSPFLVPKMISNMAAGRVAIEHNAQGPCLPIVTACATGTHAIGEAFRAIQLGSADAIIAGGAEAGIADLGVAGFINAQALNTGDDPELLSLPFDARRTGFVIGEGAGIVVLEEYENAVARGAHIYAEVVGYGNTCDAFHMTAPNPEAIASARAIALAVEEGQLLDCQHLYINAHGTGTPLNDAAETLAIKKALGEEGARRAMISSTKSMTGHLLGAAGGVEAIVAALAIDQGKVPPTIGLTQPDPECDLDYTPLVMREAPVEAAISTSLGFGGHNACIALRKVGA